jgi:hypothetical protein
MKKLFFTIFTASVILLLSACSETIINENNDPGRLIVKVTDAPFPISSVESATVTITKVEIRKVCDSICDGNPYSVIWEDTATFNLLELRNGIVEELLNIEIPQGEYDLIRLYVDEASLMIKDQPEPFSVKVPSGQQTGIKIFIKPGLIIDGGLTSEVLLDFDLSRSFVMRGNLNHPGKINGFIFKPVIRAVNNTTAGRIEGFVTDTSKVKLANAAVWVKQDTIISTAFTDTLGHYALIGLPSGSYSIFAAKANYDTVKYEGIKVLSGNRTIQNFVLTKK